MMDSHYDPVAEILHVRFAPAKIVESEEAAPGVVLDVDADGRIVALEVQGTKNRLPRDFTAATARVA